MHMPSAAAAADSILWYALRTRPRQEDRAVENLTAWGIPTLAPKVRERSGSGRLSFLFPGYIFARFSVTTMSYKVRFTRGVSYIVSFGGVPAEITDEIITLIAQRTDHRGIVTPGTALQRGDLVVIQSGPMRDFLGVFEEELSDGERVRILLTTVAYTARVEISKYDVRKPHSVAMCC